MNKMIKVTIIMFVILSLMAWLAFVFITATYIPGNWEQDVRTAFVYLEATIMALSPCIAGMIDSY